MSPVYLDGIHLEAQLDGVAWTDLVGDVIMAAGIRGRYGILANGPLDRVAPAGELTFVLRDNALNRGGRAGTYTPGSPYALPGFSRGCRVRLRLEYSQESYIKFSGRISDIRPDRVAQTAAITVTDFMDLAARHDLRLVQYASNRRIDEIVPWIVANMPVAPDEMELNPGQDTFPDVFDTVRDQTKAMTEFAKLAASELGFIYPKYGRGHGETLTVEGRYTRAYRTALQQLEYPVDLSGLLALESGERLLQEDGSQVVLNGDRFTAYLSRYAYTSSLVDTYLAAETLDHLLAEDGGGLFVDTLVLADVINPFLDIDMEHGGQLFNQIRYTAYPRAVDPYPTTVLYALNSSLSLAPGETKSGILGRYRDPVGGAARVSGRDMVAPVATTDYVFNSQSNGAGTDLTAALTVSASYGTDGVAYSLTNTGVTTGYVTKLQARGRGVYVYDPITMLVEDVASEIHSGVSPLTLDLPYQRSIETALSFSSLFLNQYRQARLIVNGARFLANRNAEMLTMFLAMEPGQRMHLAERVSGVDEDMFINGVAYEIINKLAYCTWYLKSASFSLGNYWLLGTVGRSELEQTTILGY